VLYKYKGVQLKRLYKLLLPLSLAAFGTQLHAKNIKHTVKKGESLYSIAHKNHTTIETLRKINHLKKGEVLKVGKVITIPSSKKIKVAKTSRVKTKLYKIKKGDTLTSIAKKYHTNITKLAEINHLKSNTTLKVGKSIKVPTKLHYATKSKSTKKLAKVLKKKRIHNKYASNDIVFHSKGTSKKAKKIIQLAKSKLGRRYVWGATGSNAFDCSGLTTYVCKLNGINLPRRAIAQSKVGKYVPRSQLKPGDLIFFDTSKHRKGYVNHVGIYIGNGKFIHASSAKHKVTITSLNKPFYSQRFKVARRVAL
jgi:cell wall-associated NlpC family hydrolase